MSSCEPEIGIIKRRMPGRRLIIAKEFIMRQEILSGDSRRFQECSISQEIEIIKHRKPGRRLIITKDFNIRQKILS